MQADKSVWGIDGQKRAWLFLKYHAGWCPKIYNRKIEKRGKKIMIQDIAPHRYRNEYHPKPPEKDSIMLCYEGHQVLLEKQERKLVFDVCRVGEGK